MYPNVYSNIIDNSQIMEGAQMCTDRWMDKEDVVYTHNGILINHWKEWNLAICSDMDGARLYYVKWNKSVRERLTPYDFTHVEFKEQNKWTWVGNKKWTPNYSEQTEG